MSEAVAKCSTKQCWRILQRSPGSRSWDCWIPKFPELVSSCMWSLVKTALECKAWIDKREINQGSKLAKNFTLQVTLSSIKSSYGSPIILETFVVLFVVVRRYRRRRCTVESGRSVVSTHMASKSKVWFADTATYLALGNGLGCTGTLVLVSTVTTIRCSLIYGLQ